MKPTYDLFMSIFENGQLGDHREKLIGRVSGHILEIGVGTGVNLHFYDANVSGVLTDLSLSKLIPAKKSEHFACREASVMSLPFEDKIFDAVVSTLVFCSVADVDAGLREIKRVLKDQGHLFFIEHVLPEKKPLSSVFNMVTPIWKHIAGGCHLNRDYLKSLKKAGFSVEEVSKFNHTVFVSGIAKKLVE